MQVEELKKTQCTTETDDIVTSAALELALTGADNSDGKPTPKQLQFYEENKNRIGEALMHQVEDDAFSVLGADEYLAVRTKPSLERMIERLPKLSSKRKMLQVRKKFHLPSTCMNDVVNTCVWFCAGSNLYIYWHLCCFGHFRSRFIHCHYHGICLFSHGDARVSKARSNDCRTERSICQSPPSVAMVELADVC